MRRKIGTTAFFLIVVLLSLVCTLFYFSKIQKLRNYKISPRNMLKNVKDHKTPRYVLDNTKFLYPCLDGGPNNQLRGLMKSVNLAIETNRTLVIPKFFEHLSQKKVDAAKRINVEKLNEFLSTVSFEKIRNRYDCRFNVLVWAVYKQGRSNRICGLGPDKERLLSKKPEHLEKFGFKNYYLNTSKLKDIHEKCISLIHPFSLSIDVKNNEDLINYLPRPKCVVDIADHFATLIKEPFFAFHWRHSTSVNAKKISPTRTFTSDDISGSVLNAVKTVKTKNQRFKDVQTIYFATFSEVENAAAAITKLREFYTVYTLADLQIYLKEHELPCSSDWSVSPDMISLIEMEICVSSDYFFYSPHSTWSNNVLLTRHYQKNQFQDSSVYFFN